MHWFLRNGTSNLIDRVTILRCHIDFTHAHVCRIDNNILIWATTHYFCDTEEKDRQLYQWLTILATAQNN